MMEEARFNKAADRVDWILVVAALIMVTAGAVQSIQGRCNVPARDWPSQSPRCPQETAPQALTCWINDPSPHIGQPRFGQVRAPARTVTEQDPFRRCACKALAGRYGRLQEWQRKGYQFGLDRGAKCDTRIWATQYYPAEGYDRGEETRSGYGCSERVAAATAIPLFGFVWTNRTGIRQVLDTGSRRNDQIARRKGAELWVDFWVPRAGMYGFDTAVMRAAVIRR